MICANGLVDILDNDNNDNIINKFRLMDKIPVNSSSNICNSRELNNREETPLSRAFFSKENLDIISNNIIRGVYDKTGKIIDKQDPNQLFNIMRSVFLEDCRDEHIVITGKNNKVYSDRELIVNLNNRVVNLSVKSIENELIAYYKYRQDISTLAVPQDLPILSNMRNKTLELKPWF